jgi:orotate phosphoribosyltransferase
MEELVTFEQLNERSDDELLDRLKKVILEHSILRGEFTLKSGARSSWFIDAKATACRPEGILLIALLTLRRLPPEVTAIGGQTMGSDPIAFGVAAIGAVLGRPLRSFSIRKEVKDHGGGGRVAGALVKGDRVAIVEDASTRGTSMMAAVEAAQEVGAEVVFATSVVDRGGSAGAYLATHGIPYVPLLRATDLDLPFEGGLPGYVRP